MGEGCPHLGGLKALIKQIIIIMGLYLEICVLDLGTKSKVLFLTAGDFHNYFLLDIFSPHISTKLIENCIRLPIR